MAGETLVLANLIINADGTITGVAKAQQAVAGLRTTTNQAVPEFERKFNDGFNKVGLTTRRLTEGFFNFRQLIRGLFLGFSVGGMVLALGQLVSSAIMASEGFKTLKASVEDFFAALLTGESAVETIGRHLKALGMTPAGEILEKIKGYQVEIQKGQDLLAKGYYERTTGFSKEGLYLDLSWAGVDNKVRLTNDQMIILRKNIAEAAKQVGILKEQYDKMGAAAKIATQATDLSGPAYKARPESALAFPTGAGAEEARATFDSVALGLNLMLQQYRTGSLDLDTFDQKLQTSISVLRELGFTLEQIGAIGAVQFSEGMAQMVKDAELLAAKYEAVANIVSMMGGALGAAANAGLVSAKNAWRISQLLLAAESIMRGKFELAQAVAAAGTMGRQWEVPFHTLAAKLYFATAAFQGLGALLGGGGGGGGGSGGSRGGREAASVSEGTTYRSTVAPVYQITIDGGIWMGTKEEIARLMAEINRASQRDNA